MFFTYFCIYKGFVIRIRFPKFFPNSTLNKNILLTMKDIRWSNMELCRIFAIICVMLLHSTFSSLGYDVSFGVYLLAGFSIIGVNTFVMLTGYFSATPKKSSLISIAFMCLFWTIIKVIFHYSFNEELNYKDFFFIINQIGSYHHIFFYCFSLPYSMFFVIQLIKKHYYI